MAPKKGGHARARAVLSGGSARVCEGGRRAWNAVVRRAQNRTWMNRKYLIRLLNRAETPKRKGKRRKRGAKYGAAVVTALVQVWDIFEQPCGERLASVLRCETDRLRRLGELRCSEETAEKLKMISASTIDRLWRREKRARLLRRNGNPGVQRLIHQKVPVKVAADWDTSEIGNVQVDFAAHCGRPTGGDYVHTISIVDVATNWWGRTGVAVRSQHATRDGLDQIGPRFPVANTVVSPDSTAPLEEVPKVAHLN
jgi:phage tail protein X